MNYSEKLIDAFNDYIESCIDDKISIDIIDMFISYLSTDELVECLELNGWDELVEEEEEEEEEED